MSARMAKYTLVIPMLIILAMMAGWDVLGGAVLIILGVSFGVLWERYSSEFSVLGKPRGRR